MALQSKTISAKGSRDHHTFILTVTEDRTNVSTNESILSFEFKLVDDNDWFWSAQGTYVSYKITIGSHTYEGYIPHHTNVTTNVRSEDDITEIHNSDGTKTINIGFTVTDSSSIYYLPGNASASSTMALTTIPRASGVSVGNVTISSTSGTLSATINPQASFWHRWKYVIGSYDSGWTNMSSAISSATSISVAYTTILSKISASSSGTVVFTVETHNSNAFNSSSYIGTASATSTVTITLKPSAPTLTTLGFRSRSSGVNSNITTPTAGYTTVALTSWSNGTSSGATSYTTYFSVDQGASLKTTSATANNTVIETNTLPSSAKQYTLTYTAYTVDSRGNKSANATKTVVVYGYSTPTLNLTAYRVASSSDTTEDATGTYAYVTFSNTLRGQTDANGALISGNQNAIVSATCKYGSTTVTSGQHIALAVENTLTFTYTVQDRFTTTSTTRTVNSASFPLDLYDNGSGSVGVGFGAVAVGGRVTSALPISMQNLGWFEGAEMHTGSLTYEGNSFNGAHSIAGKLYFVSTNTASGNKSVYAMNNAGTYKEVIRVDQNNACTFYGNAVSANSATIATNATNATNANSASQAMRLAGYAFTPNEVGYTKLGELVHDGNGLTTEIIVYTGQGFNASSVQNGWARIQIKNAWQSEASATNAFGITYEVYGFQMSSFEVIGIAKDYRTLEVWVYTPWTYGYGYYVINGYADRWSHWGTFSATAPTGTTQNRTKINSDESIVLWTGTLQGGASTITLPSVVQHCRRVKIFAYMAGELNMVWEVDLSKLDASTARHVNHSEPIYISNPGGWYMTTAQVKMTKTTLQFESALNIRFDGTNHVVTQNGSNNYIIYRIDGII